MGAAYGLCVGPVPLGPHRAVVVAVLLYGPVGLGLLALALLRRLFCQLRYLMLSLAVLLSQWGLSGC